ncbi:MAG: TIGR04255 family protein [Gemmataceae bacterium]
MTDTPDYANPPIVELVLGAQFSPLTKLTAGHFGRLWSALSSDWSDPADAPLLDEQFEAFDRPRRQLTAGPKLRLEPVRLPGRFLLHKGRDRLLQVQSTRFHLNWRKGVGFYPSYKKLISEFEDLYSLFETFVRECGLGMLAVNQWELTYIDAFPKDEYWRTPAEWSKVLPGLFGDLFGTDDAELGLEHRAAEWSYEIRPKRGRLHVAAHPGRAKDDNRDSLLLQMTARGPVGKGGSETLRAGLDLGHDVAYKAFLNVTSSDAKKRWVVRA